MTALRRGDPFLGSAKKPGKRDGWHPTVLVRGQQAKRKEVVSFSMNYDSDSLFPPQKRFGLKGFCVEGGFKFKVVQGL